MLACPVWCGVLRCGPAGPGWSEALTRRIFSLHPVVAGPLLTALPHQAERHNVCKLELFNGAPCVGASPSRMTDTAVRETSRHPEVRARRTPGSSRRILGRAGYGTPGNPAPATERQAVTVPASKKPPGAKRGRAWGGPCPTERQRKRQRGGCNRHAHAAGRVEQPAGIPRENPPIPQHGSHSQSAWERLPDARDASGTISWCASPS
jgi:hypothetical protein